MSPCNTQKPVFKILTYGTLIATQLSVQQSLDPSSISHSKLSGTPGVSEEGHVMQGARPDPILQSNFVGKPHLMATPQTSLQVPRTRWLRYFVETFWAPKSGMQVGSANAHIDSPHEESMHRPNADDVDRITPVQLSGRSPATPCGTSCVSCSSSSSPSGPSLVTKTTSPRDISSPEPRPEPGRGRSQVSSLSTETGGKVTHSKKTYPKHTVVPERVPLRLDRTIPAADPPFLQQPRPVERNNSCIATNEDLDYDPKQTTDKVSPVRRTAGADENVLDEHSLYDTTMARRRRAESDPQSDDGPQFIPIPRASSSDVRVVPHVIQTHGSSSTHSHRITESRKRQERRLEKSSADIHHTHMVHVDSSREAHAHRPVGCTDSLPFSGEPFV